MLRCCWVGKPEEEKEGVGEKSELYQPIRKEELKLVQLQVLFRHGARTPINLIKGIEQATYDKSLSDDIPETVFHFEVVRYHDGQPAEDSALEFDLKNVKLKGGCYASVLTTVGQKQMYTLGKTLRDGYFKDLEINTYSPEFVRLRTTQLTRTIKSLRCVMAGMFGASHLNQVETVKFAVKSVFEEDLFPNKVTCPTLRLGTDIALARLSSHASYKRDKGTVLNALGGSCDECIDFASLWDDLSCRKAHGLPIPSQLEPLLDLIETNAAKTIYAAYSGKIVTSGIGSPPLGSCKDTFFNVTKLAIGRLVHTIITQMERFVHKNCLVKLYLYSAHDTSMTPMLEALGIWDFVWPPFGCNIVFELYERKRDAHFFVRVLYCGEPKKLRDATGHLIPLNDFRTILQKYRLPQFLYSKSCLIHYVS